MVMVAASNHRQKHQHTHNYHRQHYLQSHVNNAVKTTTNTINTNVPARGVFRVITPSFPREHAAQPESHRTRQQSFDRHPW